LGAIANPAEIKVLSTVGVKSVVDELGPQFERETGHKLAITFGIANVMRKQIEAGESFDLAIMTAPVADALIKQGKMVAATRTDVARGGIGIAVRAGAPESWLQKSDPAIAAACCAQASRRIHTAVSWNTAPPFGHPGSALVSALMPRPFSK
jgi:molybdate transport system substrate-binding protein